MLDHISKKLTNFIYNQIELSLTQEEYVTWHTVLCGVEELIRIMRETEEIQNDL